LPRQYFDK